MTTTPTETGTESVELEPAPTPAPSSLAHLSDRELAEATAHAINSLADNVAYLVAKVTQAEALLMAMGQDPKLRMLLGKLG